MTSTENQTHTHRICCAAQTYLVTEIDDDQYRDEEGDIWTVSGDAVVNPDGDEVDGATMEKIG